ncbi:Uncharacterised protein [Vibrio cholerae]|nr:Uncharacterised protein [Vibrio cholerae]
MSSASKAPLTFESDKLFCSTPKIQRTPISWCGNGVRLWFSQFNSPSHE